MDMLRKLAEEKMKKGVHGQSDEESSKKKTAQLGVLDHISRMAEGAMSDDLKNNVSGHNTSSADKGSGMSKGAARAESMVSAKNTPLHTDSFDGEEESHHPSEGLTQEVDDATGEETEHHMPEGEVHMVNDRSDDEEDKKRKGYR